MAEFDYNARPRTTCLGCGKADPAPKDQVALPDGNSVFYHMDCHVIVANCQVCKGVLTEVAGGHTAKGKKNEELLSAILDAQDQEAAKQPRIFTTGDAVMFAAGKEERL